MGINYGGFISKTLFFSKILFLFKILFLSTVVWGGNLSLPFYFDSAEVLPKGVRNLRYNYLMGEANDKFGSSETVVGVGHAMNMDISYERLVDSQETEVKKGILKGYLTRHGRNMEDLAGKVTGEVNVEVDAQIPIFALGVTKKWTMAFVLPIVKTRTHVDTGFVASSDLRGIVDMLPTEGKRFKAQEVKRQTDRVIPDKADDYGYKPLPPPLSYSEKTSLADIRFINKVQLYDTIPYKLALISKCTLPTGRSIDIHQVVDVPTGDGQWDLSAGIIGQYYLENQITLWTQWEYNWQSSDKVARRVPKDRESSLSPDLDGQIFRNLGDQLYLSIGGSLNLYKDIKIKSQYTFQYKQRDEYRGNQYEPIRYRIFR